jgi:hypothetical protein
MKKPSREIVVIDGVLHERVKLIFGDKESDNFLKNRFLAKKSLKKQKTSPITLNEIKKIDFNNILRIDTRNKR